MTVAIESTLQSMWTECQGCTSESQERLQEVVSELEASLTAFICKVVALEVEPSETLGDAVAVLLLDNISTTKHSHALIDILHVEWCFLNEDDDASHVRKNRILWIVKSCLVCYFLCVFLPTIATRIAVRATGSHNLGC